MLIKKENPALVGGTTWVNGANQNVKQLQNTRPLSRKQVLMVESLLGSLYGIPSNELREIGRCMNDEGRKGAEKLLGWI